MHEVGIGFLFYPLRFSEVFKNINEEVHHFITTGGIWNIINLPSCICVIRVPWAEKGVRGLASIEFGIKACKGI